MVKKFFKKENGFTLVELLAVIAILAIILAIAIPAIGNVIEKSERDAHEANVELFENAARLAYISDEALTDGGYTLAKLVQLGYLEEIPEDPLADGDTTYTDTLKVTVTEAADGRVTYQFADPHPENAGE